MDDQILIEFEDQLQKRKLFCIEEDSDYKRYYRKIDNVTISVYIYLLVDSFDVELIVTYLDDLYVKQEVYSVIELNTLLDILDVVLLEEKL